MYKDNLINYSILTHEYDAQFYKSLQYKYYTTT